MALVTRTLTNAGAPLYSPDGDLLVGVKIHFQLMDTGGRPSDAWDAITNERVGGDVKVATTDTAGEFSVDLWPNTRGNRVTKYKCRVQFEGFREFSGVVEDVPGELQWVDFMLSGSSMEPQDISAIAVAMTSHLNAADPHTQYAKESDLGGAALLDVGTTTGTVAAGDDARLTDSRPPTGGAGGVLSGNYPNPGFAVDMATQGELDAVAAAKVDKVTGKGLSTEDYSTAEKSKLAGIADGATANATDAQLRDRTTHTGAQAISTVTGLQGALDAKAPLASPALTGVPSAPTAAAGTNTTQLATTAFAKAQIAADAAPAAHVGSGGAAHANAVASGAAGFMTGADKTKLDGIATGANNYTHPANHPPSIITQDASNRFVTDTEKSTWNAKEPAIAAGTTAQYRRGDKTWQPVADLPVSTAQAAADLLKVDKTSLSLTAAANKVPQASGAGKLDPSWLNDISGALPASRPALLLDFANSLYVDPRITFTRASAATRVNSTGLLESVASNVPRLDYDPITLECKGLLIEESRTNLLTYSEQFDNADWIKSRCTVTANAITAPDGTLTADKMVEDTQTGAHHLNRGGFAFVSGTTYTISQHVKAAERNKCALGLGNSTVTFNGGAAAATFDLVAKTATKGAYGLSAGIQELPGGWFRVWLTGTADSTGNDTAFAPFLNNGSTTSYTGDGTSGIYIWGAQLEVGSFPTSYVPTTTTAVTRAADVAAMTGMNFSEWATSVGTILAKYKTAGWKHNNTPPVTQLDLTKSVDNYSTSRAGDSIERLIFYPRQLIADQIAALKD